MSCPLRNRERPEDPAAPTASARRDESDTSRTRLVRVDSVPRLLPPSSVRYASLFRYVDRPPSALRPQPVQA